ncbi:MAG: hypothetical protein MUF64_17850 [Polyangiaceae bacterium]|jgi:hypothetical protein|nr:hypothetical protein [Polyangiaceae bacterium]
MLPRAAGLSLFTAVSLLWTSHAAAEHGPSAPSSAFPSHQFQLAPRAPSAQLSFHYGLLQPLLLRGFNAAVDLRLGRLVLSYSHGQGLDVGRAPGTLTAEETRAGTRAIVPYSTGGGIGFTLLDELYVMADFKAHRYELSAGSEISRYTTVTVGAEVGWRFFLWRGLHITPVVRYWPNVWTSAPEQGVKVRTRQGTDLLHQPISQGSGGFFANVLLGWAFDL